MTDPGNTQWYAHKKKEDKTLGPYSSAVEALASCFAPEITLSRGRPKAETIVGDDGSTEPSDTSETFPCDMIPRTRDYTEYK